MRFLQALTSVLLAAASGVLGRVQAAAADRPPESAPRQVAEVREIDDPNSGDRWLLMRDAVHPGGPGRLVRVGSVFSSEFPHRDQSLKAVALPVVHAGDRVRLEEHTPVVDAVFESVALGPASAGEQVQVRLRIGGRVVRAVATAPGRAVIAAEIEVQP